MNPSRDINYARQNLLQALDQGSVPAAVAEFTAPVANAFRSSRASIEETGNTVEGELWERWTTLLSAAADTPYSGEGGRRQDALVDLLMGVQSLGTLSRDDGTQCIVWNSKVWEDLPIFGPTVREEFNFGKLDIKCCAKIKR